jgi:hypothetical protein
MNESFEGAHVDGWESLLDGITLPDPNDRHVVAAAVSGRADVIVTSNLHNFPDDALRPFDLHATSPDDFLLDEFDLDPHGTIEALYSQARAMNRPTATLNDVLTALEAAGGAWYGSKKVDRF